ncbi:MAG: homocysteine S-methyltransferase family protein [Deltaproteobacteria bacterium]|nr:homocysteine S-methyltransferase family protein [Deltaproteobacteria bacterium]
MTGLAERLTGKRPLVLDGGLGTMLIARGLGPGEPPESWNVNRPDDVASIHRAYVEAGSEAVHTNSFGATAARLGPRGLAGRASELAAASVGLARSSGARFVLGDVGPTGEYLPPVGRGDPAAWRRDFLALGRALAGAGVDAFHVETMSDLREALVALEALREAAPSVPVLVSMTFEKKPRGFFTVMGDGLAPALSKLARAGAAAVGANCSVTSEDMLALASQARAAVQAPIVLQPNAGAPRLEDGRLRYDQAPERFAEDMVEVRALGVEALGGCCGTDPRFIAALRRGLE